MKTEAPVSFFGTVTALNDNLVRCEGLNGVVGIGDLCSIGNPMAKRLANLGGSDRASIDQGLLGQSGILAEVVGFAADHAFLLPYDDLDGLAFGASVQVEQARQTVRPHASWRGRVLDAMGTPLDGLPLLEQGPHSYSLMQRGLPAHRRRLVGDRLTIGVRAIDLFTPCCQGQRLGIFAGSGVGKSTTLSMIAKGSDADIIIVGLIGERGRELNEFLERSLGADGLARSVVIAATSDTPALVRRRAAYLTMTIAEYFRDQGAKVLCLLDSVTRFAMALREIRLAAGEAPAARGYPAGVFAELPRLLERAGPGEGEGSITAFFSVLVDGDDTNEPITDAVRGILDGHVQLDRAIAEAGRFPAIDVLKSISRTAPACYAERELPLVSRARKLMHNYAQMAELIELGAYQHGTNPELDEAIRVRPNLEALLQQRPDQQADLDDSQDRLAQALADVAVNDAGGDAPIEVSVA
ncbi:MAG: FliI/YscN family ATPase [Pseudomonadota bacterium]